jgi:hypothetical protein
MKNVALGNHCKGTCTSWLKEYTFLLLMTYVLWKNYMIVCLMYLSEFIDSEGRKGEGEERRNKG